MARGKIITPEYFVRSWDYKNGCYATQYLKEDVNHVGIRVGKTEIYLSYNRDQEEIKLYTEGRLLISPAASNVVNIDVKNY